MSSARNYESFSQLQPGTVVKPTDIYAATDVTDLTQSPSGSTKRYTISQLGAFLQVGIAWNHVTATSANLAVNQGYVADNVGLVTLTLPAVAPFGSMIWVQGLGSGGWKIQNQAAQQIIFGNTANTTGTTGYIASTNANDSVLLLCVVANTTFTVLLGPQGNLTVN